MLNYYLFRGFKNSFSTGERKNKYLERPRRPLHNSMEIHLKADDWFFNKYGYKFRSQSLFCYGSSTAAAHYGKVGIIEPIGEHKVCWSPIIMDLYFQCNLYSKDLTLEQILESGEYKTFTFEDKELMDSATKSRNEIMLWCKEFRVIDPSNVQVTQIVTATDLII